MNRAIFHEPARGGFFPLRTPRRRRSGPPLVEALESRQLLSILSPATNAVPAPPPTAPPAPAAVSHDFGGIPPGQTFSHAGQSYGATSITINGGSITGQSTGLSSPVIGLGFIPAGIGSLGNGLASAYIMSPSAFPGAVLGSSANFASSSALAFTLGSPIAGPGPGTGADLAALRGAFSVSVLEFPAPASNFSTSLGAVNSNSAFTSGSTSGTLAAAGSTSAISGTSLFPVSVVVIIVPVGSREVVVIVPVAPVHTASAPVTEHAAPLPLLPSSAPVVEFSILVAMAKYGQGPTAMLTYFERMRFDVDVEIPGLIDAVTRIKDAPVRFPPIRLVRPDRSPAPVPPPVTPSSFLFAGPVAEAPEGGAKDARLPEAVPVGPVSETPEHEERGRESPSPPASAASTLAGAAATAGFGLWMTLRESRRCWSSTISRRFARRLGISKAR